METSAPRAAILGVDGEKNRGNGKAGHTQHRHLPERIKTTELINDGVGDVLPRRQIGAMVKEVLGETTAVAPGCEHHDGAEGPQPRKHCDNAGGDFSAAGGFLEGAGETA